MNQGFYPDGIYTTPTEAAFVRDINFHWRQTLTDARLHEKVFELRFLYHCDRMGYSKEDYTHHGNIFLVGNGVIGIRETLCAASELCEDALFSENDVKSEKIGKVIL